MIAHPNLRDAAVLVSGGIDSVVLTRELTRQFARVHPIYVRFGLRWEAAELAALREFLDRWKSDRVGSLVVLDQPVSDVYDDHWSVGGGAVPDDQSADESVYLPGRNLLLVAKAALWCQARGVETLAIGSLAGNPFADGADFFFRSLEATLHLALGGRIELIRPFQGLTKAQVTQLGADLPLDLTFSCLDPIDGRHCGSCNKCGERRQAFRSIDRADLMVDASHLTTEPRKIPCTE